MTSPNVLCRACGRPIVRRGRGQSDARVYCSKRCRSRRISPKELKLERTILELLNKRSADGSICPSEVARDQGGDTWRDLMEPVRRAGRRLAAEGKVEFTQRGRRVDAATASGPIRIRFAH